MRQLAILAALVLGAAGCAGTGPTQVASADCKVVPITTASAAGRAPRHVTPIEQRWAEMQLAATDYRRQQLMERGMYPNTVEEALRDCR